MVEYLVYLKNESLFRLCNSRRGGVTSWERGDISSSLSKERGGEKEESLY